MRPAEVVFEKYQFSEACTQMIKICNPSVLLVPLFSRREFWDEETTLQELKKVSHYL